LDVGSRVVAGVALVVDFVVGVAVVVTVVDFVRVAVKPINIFLKQLPT
jgi:hypothetical protein